MLDFVYGKIANVLPNRLVYWCFVRVILWGTTEEYADSNPARITAYKLLERWDAK